MPDESLFDAATAVRDRGLLGGPPDVRAFDVDIDKGWTIGPDKPNGGYLLAILGRAAVDAVASAGGTQPHVVAANVTYVAATSLGPATVEVEVLRIGRGASQARARLVSAGSVTVEAMFTLGSLGRGSDPWWGGAPPVDVVPEDDAAQPPRGIELPPFAEKMALRLDPSSTGFARGTPGGRGELKGWLRFADGRDFDALSLLLVVDSCPPATFDLIATGWVPTLNLTAYIRAEPAPGPLRIRFRVGMVQSGFADEFFEVWDSEDRLVATSTQVVALRIPEGTPPAPG